MSYIHDKREERTAFQSGSDLIGQTDCQCDVAMVYRVDESTERRIAQHRERGYVIHLMTGIAWGHYTDFLDGDYDGKDHWDISQRDRWGNDILHSPRVPYLCPTLAFDRYLAESLRKAVDLGAEAIYVEEPEFWERGGYSEAFKREYRLYYGEDWRPPHESLDAYYRSSKLKAYLYARAIDLIGSDLKAYALEKYGRTLKFYVPTHSIINYTQWKIVSPEGKLADIPCVDGCISQTWTGTSREKTWYNGKYEERTFETAYLEYGAMQELVKGTGREMWFLHDPIEDNPRFDWDDYRKNYFCTVAASYLHPLVNKYEICPWPHRVFTGEYPRGAEDAKPIPADYATILNNVFNMSGAIEKLDKVPSGARIGVFCGDSQLYQRAYPDSEFGGKAPEEVTGTVLVDGEDFISEIKRTVLETDEPDRENLLKYMASAAFPGFFSLANPLLINGVPLRPVLIDNARRYAGYLDDYDVLVLSYEFMKPDYPDINIAVAQWVRSGGVLVYVGDGFDPYNNISSWWTGKYANPAEHLFEMLGITPEADKSIFTVGKGAAAVWKTNPALIARSPEDADEYRAFVSEAGAKTGVSLEYRNYLDIRRGSFLISACMENSVSAEPKVYDGLFADMFTPGFDIITKKTVAPGQQAVLFDLDAIEDKDLEIIGTSVRFNSLERDGNKVVADVSGASDFRANIRLRVPFEPSAVAIDGKPSELTYDKASRTALISFDSVTGHRELIVTGVE